MNFPSIRIEGAILSPDILDRLEDVLGQRPADFGLDTSLKVKDEIARAWADAQDYWRIFQRKLETLKADSPATTETRNNWIVPLLGLFGYQLEYQARGTEVNSKNYPISHRVTNGGHTAIHIIGYRDPTGLDQRRMPQVSTSLPPSSSTLHPSSFIIHTSPRMSAHAMVQEYLNLTDQLYGLVTNGRILRLLRDSSRLVKLSYLEFDLDRIFADGLFADFAVLFRLLHASRLPQAVDTSASCWLERYHQDSLDSGARIRDGLSRAVEHAIRTFANGFLVHPDNEELRNAIASGDLAPDTYYQCLLRLIYRILFLLVIEERDLVYPSTQSATQRDLYYRYYSLQRLRRLAEKRYLADRRQNDLWFALRTCFRLFEADGPGHKLGLAPLAGDLFNADSIGLLDRCILSNEVLLDCLRSLSIYQNPNTGQVIRVNYAALNVEEFGSVYEGLLEYQPVFVRGDNRVEFAFAQGDARAATGSHYTPDDLVQPLLKHSLDYLIAERLEKAQELANREIASRGREIYVDQLVSRSHGLAKGHANSRGVLPSHPAVPESGDVRPDLSDSSGLIIDSSEHRGGMGARRNTGVSPVPASGTGQSEGTGDAPHSQSSGRTSTGRRSGSTPGAMQRGGEDDSFPDWFFAAQAAVGPNSLPSYSLLAANALLSLRVADIACGSGHILLAAARRIATELAVVRTGEEQPSPAAFRAAVRDVIRECIYGVDLNPLAVELCKVALWLEAHNPGEPLNFLDHHIKCGNAIVGFARRDELERGVPDEAFVTMPGDDKAVAAALRKRNKEERAAQNQGQLDLAPEIQKQLDDILKHWREISGLSERTPKEIETKKRRYLDFTKSQDAWMLSQIACIPIAQFYLPKTEENRRKLITDAEFRLYWSGERRPQGQATAEAWALAFRRRFFHWFLEFPDVIEGTGKSEIASSEIANRAETSDSLPPSLATSLSPSPPSGFDCILGNPPYLGGTYLSGTYGYPFCHYVKWEYAPAGLSDLVVYFIRRIYSLLRPGGFTAFITTNSIKDGDIRKDGLEQMLAQGGSITFAVRGIKWPGRANLIVSLLSLHKGEWSGPCYLDGKLANYVSSFLEDSRESGDPNCITENADRMFEGAKFIGDGFLLSLAEADALRVSNPENSSVIFPLINAKEVNNHPEQSPSRCIINFFDWPQERAEKYSEVFSIVEQKVKPVRAQDNREQYRIKWWLYAEARRKLSSNLKYLSRCFVTARTTKHLNFSAMPTNLIFSDALDVFTTDRWDLYTVVQSTIHEVWARKYSGALKQDLRYSPSKCFDTFPFPEGLWQTVNPALAAIGERYHERRRLLMHRLWLGLTDIYNLFHARNLTPALVAEVSGKSEEAEAGYQGLLELRALHHEMDNTVLTAYGWTDLALGHDFHELEYLPENDRVRYTISPDARKEVLRHLLALNHERAATQATVTTQKKKMRRSSAADEPTNAEPELFS